MLKIGNGNAGSSLTGGWTERMIREYTVNLHFDQSILQVNESDSGSSFKSIKSCDGKRDRNRDEGCFHPWPLAKLARFSLHNTKISNPERRSPTTKLFSLVIFWPFLHNKAREPACCGRLLAEHDESRLQSCIRRTMACALWVRTLVSATRTSLSSQPI